MQPIMTGIEQIELDLHHMPLELLWTKCSAPFELGIILALGTQRTAMTLAKEDTDYGFD
jgi:hypothetical protein